MRKLGIGMVALVMAGTPLLANASTHNGHTDCNAGGV